MSEFLKQYRGRRVTVMGLGRFGGGVAAAEFLARNGACVSVTDLRTRDELADSIRQLEDVPIAEFVCGDHPSRLFRQCDLLVVNPAVRPDHPAVELARQLHADITTEIDLFLRHNPARVTAVTGSNGKSTTAAMIHHLLQQTRPGGCQRVLLGGNIGISLLPQLPQLTSDDYVVLELSSFQLELLRIRRFRPQTAVITGFAANHLDWHGTVDAYRRAKQGILDAQVGSDMSILPESDGIQPDWMARGHVHRFGLTDYGEDGGFLEAGMLTVRTSPGDHRLMTPGRDAGKRDSGIVEESVRFHLPTRLFGIHQRQNLAAACLAAWLHGAPADQFSAVMQSFVPLPHRLQLVMERYGRRFFNDSIATTPESAICALQSCSGRIVVLAGGHDKGQDLNGFADELRKRAAVVVLMGQTADLLERLIRTEHADSIRQRPLLAAGKDFGSCFSLAMEHSRPGDTILLSPGCASYGWFRDYRDRGEQFERLAADWKP